MSVLDRCRQSDIREYMEQCAYVSGIDPDSAARATLAAIRISDKRPANLADFRPLFDLEKRWYDSLAIGTPDYSVYREPYYFCDLWSCWAQYSCQYLKMILKDKARYGSPKTIVDLGCGFGYTTAALKEIFPDAAVYGTNIPDTSQWTMAVSNGIRYGFSVVSNSAPVSNVDVVFASEYFEHFESPLEELHRVLVQYRPKWLIAANAFTGRAIGHFTRYRDVSCQYHNGKEMNKLFTEMMKRNCYHSVSTPYWNKRPAVWKLTAVMCSEQLFS